MNKLHHFLGVFCLILCVNCSPEGEIADTILYNGKVVTVDSAFSFEEAVAIKNGKFIAVGNDEIIKKHANENTREINLEGRTVIPGLIDNHAHPIGASQSEYFRELPDLKSNKDLLAWIEMRSGQKDPGEWIIHPKFFFTRMKEKMWPSLQALDSVAPNNPVFLNGAYAGKANTKAIEVSGLKNSGHDGIIREENTGNPTGIIRRSAFGLLARPERQNLPRDKKIELLKNLFFRYNKVGITSICSGMGDVEDLKLFKALMERRELTVRVFHNMGLPFKPDASLKEMGQTLKEFGYTTGDGNKWVKVGALKTVLDGGVLTGTAFLRDEWGNKAKEVYGIHQPDYRGELFHAKEQLIRMITAAYDAGWKFTAHVTGGGGVDTLLAAYEEVNHLRPVKGRRFSVIHGNFFTPGAIGKMADLGVYADMQPMWFYKDVNLLKKVLGQKRTRTFHPYQSMMEANVVINGGSDHMVKEDPNKSINPYNPFLSMWAVITRKTEDGTVEYPGEALSRKQALKMYTINNAYASFEEDQKGSIEEGKFADLVVLSKDYMTCPEDSIKKITSELTMVDGRIVFEKEIRK